jgi:beta-N-acetylhexosaminidase
VLAAAALAGCGETTAPAPTATPYVLVDPIPTADLSTPPDPYATPSPSPSPAATPPSPTPAATAQPADTSATRPAAAPPIVRDFIPFDARRRRETAAYARRHYAMATWQLDPKVIVEHYTVTSSYPATRAIFAVDRADSELHELPGTCSHFVVDHDGTIYQLVPLTTICRHTVGLNYAAIGIEHVAMSQPEALADPRQRRASLALTHWLSCRYGIGISNVIGHAESLRSPYHFENVAALRTQTHGDFPSSAMRPYRAALRRFGGC